MAPLNDLLLGQTFMIETNDQSLFANGSQVNYFVLYLVYKLIWLIIIVLQLITFQQINSDGQIDNIQTISTIDSEKPTIQNMNFTMDSNNQFQNICTNCKLFVTT